MSREIRQPLPRTAVKLITCVLPDNGSDKALMQALRAEKQLVSSSSVACRGIAVLQSVKSKHDQLPEPSMVRKVELVVPYDDANALFDYIYARAGIGLKGGGTMFMGPLINTTLFELPEGIADEKHASDKEHQHK